MRILFISDLHLGDGSSNAEGKKGADDFGDNDDKFLKWVNDITPDKIYLVGDIYELWQFKFKRIKKAHPKIVDFFKSSIVESVIGNHDYKLFGKNTITLNFSKKIIICHGHQWDKRMKNPVVRGFVWFLGIIERIPFMHWVDNPEQFTKKQSETDIKTEEYAQKLLKKADITICGHTHKKLVNGSNKVYANCGTCMGGKFEGLILDTEANTLNTV